MLFLFVILIRFGKESIAILFGQNVKEDLEGSEKDFHDPYVERLQSCVREIKGN